MAFTLPCCKQFTITIGDCIPVIANDVNWFQSYQQPDLPKPCSPWLDSGFTFSRPILPVPDPQKDPNAYCMYIGDSKCGYTLTLITNGPAIRATNWSNFNNYGSGDSLHNDCGAPLNLWFYYAPALGQQLNDFIVTVTIIPDP